MMQLYSIEYDQLTLISVFDANGNKTGDRQERVRVSMNDLPLQTAQMYRNRMKGLNFVMTAQIPGRDEPRSYRKRNNYQEQPREPKKVKSATAGPAKPSKEEQRKQAAQTGDMTAAINLKDK